MEQEATDELGRSEGHRLAVRRGVGAIVLVVEAYLAIGEIEQPMIRDGDAMGIAWGNAGQWAAAATAAGYIVEPQPTVGSIGVSTIVSPGHVGPVQAVSGSYVTNYEQQCGAGLTGGYRTPNRPASYFNAGFIRAPIPTVNLLIWSGASQATNGGPLTARRGVLGAPATVQFGFGLLRSNVNRGSSSFQSTIAGVVASTSGTFTYRLSKPGSYTIVSRVTNGLGISTTATAAVKVLEALRVSDAVRTNETRAP